MISVAFALRVFDTQFLKSSLHIFLNNLKKQLDKFFFSQKVKTDLNQSCDFPNIS